ncbi:unnamed protein product [Colias eurytheme]|nr:unnamed protein product [Colias eurytheme]
MQATARLTSGKVLLIKSGGCRSSSGAVGAVTVASAGAGAGACAGRMASAGAQFRGGQQWAAYAQPCRYPPPQQQYATGPYTPHQVNEALINKTIRHP